MYEERKSEGGLLFLSPSDLTEYLAKAHEAKIRAIKDVEDKKNNEINTLKGEVAALKEKETHAPKQSTGIVVAGTPRASGMQLSNTSKAELAAKLVQYQQFMAKYIVESQQQKMIAVKAAEEATAAKYEGKLALLLKASSSSNNDSSTPAKAADSSSSAAVAADTKLYDTRSATVAAAAKAGKSRWGDKEVAKVKISSKDTELNVKPESSKEKVNGKVVDIPTVPSTISLPSTDLYTQRSARIAAAAAAGKSRWGSAESKKATEEVSTPSLSSSTETEKMTSSSPSTPSVVTPDIMSTPSVVTPDIMSTPSVVTPEIKAADHGLRNDGGVGGPSLAERVNLGQQLFTGGSNAVVATPPSSASIPNVKVLPPSMYDLRNAKIAAAAAAGKSRWGEQENGKATILASNALPSGSPTEITVEETVAVMEIPVPPEVEAADHGLRNDGGVGGPSLAERILGGRLTKHE
eukprot:CAMPEP_0170787702 /NCGR_PEP_ID=MMETSP0733-20121128/18445_1 /TAXON_ID=186038 /ORGANISM="Fragilariopsis kerguelensis, Strain L26-C5" /LENGTH=463 /DNA_ID=CAMNT_0011133969 /DNA_START=257 /DNA_END=1649 /DNA_ORIENTATION=-